MNFVPLRPFLALLLLGLLLPAARAAEDFPPGPDSQRQPGVPEGEVFRYEFRSSAIFPGTVREVWVYVPKQYDPARPACVYVGQDGIRFEAPIVFDNLIHRGEMPVTIGIFAMHGRVLAPHADALDRFNRSYEYDGLGDHYARFLLEELLPDVEKRTAADGRPLRLSSSGNDRAIGGASSGAIAAFNAAWERPEAFSRVFSAIGTFVGQRGGDRFPTLIRKTEPKPLRVFLQGGSNDNNRYGGDWWMANQTMQRALLFSGYEVNHVWGDGGHNHRHGTMVFPEAMRWLWRGWPAPVANGPSGNHVLQELLIPGEEWQLVAEGYRGTDAPTANEKGEVFFADPRDSKVYRVAPDGAVTVFLADAKRANGQAFGPDGRLYAVSLNDPRLIAYTPDGAATVLAEELPGNDVVVAHNGNIYVTHPPTSLSNEPSKVWLVRPDGQKEVVDTGLRYANGIALSPDQTLLYVSDHRSHWVYSYQIRSDGTLQHKQRFYHLHEPDTADDSGADGMRVDREGRLYVATRMGVQICDQAGRVNAILPTPNRRLSNVSFGGENFDTLFATCGDKVYKRKLNAVGAPSWRAPHRPAPPRL